MKERTESLLSFFIFSVASYATCLPVSSESLQQPITWQLKCYMPHNGWLHFSSCLSLSTYLHAMFCNLFRFEEFALCSNCPLQLAIKLPCLIEIPFHVSCVHQFAMKIPHNTIYTFFYEPNKFFAFAGSKINEFIKLFFMVKQFWT